MIVRVRMIVNMGMNTGEGDWRVWVWCDGYS